MPFYVLLQRGLQVRSPRRGRANSYAGRYSLCNGDSPDADIDSYTNTWDRHGYGDVRLHTNALVNTFSHHFSDRGNTCRDFNPNKHADAN